MSWLGHDTNELEATLDRRGDDRTKVMQQIRIRRLDSAGKQTEQPGTLVDFSREGMLLASPFDDFEVGMELRLIFPQSASECSCEVVRAERLPNGHTALGVRILEW